MKVKLYLKSYGIVILDMLEKLESCLHLNEAYQEQYRITKDKLLTMPKGSNSILVKRKCFPNLTCFVDV